MKTHPLARLLLLALVAFLQLSFTLNSNAQFTARNEIKIPIARIIDTIIGINGTLFCELFMMDL